MLASMVRMPARHIFAFRPRVLHPMRRPAILLGFLLACMPLAAEDRPRTSWCWTCTTGVTTPIAAAWFAG